MAVDHGRDILADAEATRTMADLARVLRQLRRREARDRRGPALTYHEIADRTGWSVSVIGGYFTGVKMPSTQRFDHLIRLLGARPHEQGVLASARERAETARTDDSGGGALDRGYASVPRMLPPPVAGFIGRLVPLAQLDAMLAADPELRAVAISAVDGMAGVGKTALAVHWAHRVVGRFPDGQLYVNLRGYDPDEPLSTMDALGALLRGLGVEPALVPPDLPSRVTQYHQILAGRRTLVLLDNASSPNHARPLLPPAPSVAVVTSRDNLSELVTVDGARRVTLEVLPETEAMALLRLLVGERAIREPDAVRALARRCGHLPLALRVAAEQAACRSTVTLADLVAELSTDASGGLDALGIAGDHRADLRAVFSWSLRWLPEPAARASRLLSLVPGNDVDVFGLAALAGTDPPEAERLANILAQAHLIQADGRGRYSMHDLLRSYAAESAEHEVPVADRSAALNRLFDYYLRATTVAIDMQFPLNRSTRPYSLDAHPRPISTPDLQDVGSASAWLAAERPNLVRACVHAARHGWPRHAVSLALVLRPFLDDGHVQDGLVVHTEALAASRLLGEECHPADRASIHGCLGVTNFWLGRLTVAADQLQHAFEENTRVGNPGGAIMNVAVLGLVREAQGRYQEALACQQRGLQTARSAGIRVQEGVQLINLGYIHLRIEEYDVAADLYQQAYAIFEQGDQLSAMGKARYCLATAYEGAGRYDEALAHAEEALAISCMFDQLIDRVRVMDTIGSIYRGLGRPAEAVDQLDEALRLCRAANNPRVTAQVLNTLGEACLAAGDDSRAVASYAEALTLADQTGIRFERTRALAGLGDAWHAAGDTVLAREYWRDAYRSYADMGLPAAARLRARLTER